MSYGLPYMGSKSALAEWIVSELPPAPRLYDVFAGGCAITHRALLSRKWPAVMANDVSDAPRLFLDAIDGRYRDETRWISRDDFFRLRESDPYVRICWSFGNNQSGYLYSREIEPWKRALHHLRVLGDDTLMRAFGIATDGSRADIMAHHEQYKDKYCRWYISHELHSTEDYDTLKTNLTARKERNEEELRQYLLRALRASGLTQADVGRRLGIQMQGHYFGRSQWAFPTREYYGQKQQFMPLLTENYDSIDTLRRLEHDTKELFDLEQQHGPAAFEALQSLESLQRLVSLESLRRLQALESLRGRTAHLTVTRSDYADLQPEPGSTLYCDPPYRGTADYNGETFDSDRFYEWAERQARRGCRVFISEYHMPPDRFRCIATHRHRSLLSSSANTAVTERLFIPIAQTDCQPR